MLFTQSVSLKRAHIEVLCATYAAGGVKTESGMEGEGREIRPNRHLPLQLLPSKGMRVSMVIFHQLFETMSNEADVAAVEKQESCEDKLSVYSCRRGRVFLKKV